MATVRDSVIDTSVGAVATTISVGAVLLPEHAGSAQGAIGRALQALDIARGSRSDRFNLYRAVRAPGLRAPPRGWHRRRDRPRAQRPPHDPGAAADRHVEEPRARAVRMPAAHEAAGRLDRLGLRVHPGGGTVRPGQAGRSPRARARRRSVALDARRSSWRSTSRRRPPPTRNGCTGSKPSPERTPAWPSG